jgi:hypothetical protein
MKSLKAKFKVLCGSALATVLLSANVYAAPVLWVDDAAGNLGTVDLNTGAVTVIGNTHQTLVDIAFDPSGNLYGITFGQLYRIDRTTAATTLVGNLNAGSPLNSLVFDSAGNLFSANTGLYSINTTTGQATLIGNNGTSYSSAGDLAFSGSALYLTSNLTSTDHLIRLSTGTGAGQDVGSIGFSNVYGLASIDSILYGITGTQVLTINAATGQGTSLLDYGGRGLGTANGAAFYAESGAPAPESVVPEPATIALVSSGLLGLATFRRNSRKSKKQ